MAVFATLLGAIAGSFLNALLYRYKTGISVLRGRSKCMRCGHTLAAMDLIPVLSYLFLRGRCRYCGTRLSMQYPLVELAAMALSLGAWVLYPDPPLFAYWLLVHCTLLFIFVYDLRHKIVPLEALGVLLVLSLIHVWVWGFGFWDLAAGPLLALPLLIIFLVSRGRAMGFADLPLELALGALLGLSMGLTALLLAFWAGALVGIVLIWWGRGYTMRSEVPFAPFLILGAWVAHFFHVDFFPLLPLLF